MEQLTKENFFNQLYQDYPNAMKEFCDWIDQYKLKVNWTKFIPEAKFHDIPYEMQMGIWFGFILDKGVCYFEVELSDFDLAKDIKEYMRIKELDIKL